MLSTLRSVASLLLSYGLLVLANGLFSTLLGVRTRIEGFATEVTGLIMAGFFAGLLLGALFGARVVARVGHIRAFAAFASVMSVTALLHVLIVDPWAWVALRALAGFCMAGMVMVTESWLNERASNAIRGQVLALYMITNYFSAGAGQFLLPLADPGEFHLFSLVSVILSLALIPVLLTSAHAPTPPTPQPGNFRSLYALAPVGIVGAVCTGIVNAAFNGMAPVATQSLGLGLVQTSTFMGVAIFAGLLLQWPAGRLSDRFDRRRVILAVAGLGSLGAVAIIVATRQVTPWLFIAAGVYGSVTLTLYSLCAAHTNDRASPEQRVQTASGLLIAYGVGASCGPLIAGAVMGRFGPHGLFGMIALVLAGFAVFAAVRLRRRQPSEAASPFVPVPGAPLTTEVLYGKVRDQMDKDLGSLLVRRRR